MAVGLLALNGNAVLRLLNEIFCHYFLFCHSLSFSELWQAIVILCHSQNRQLRVRKFNAERVALSSDNEKSCRMLLFQGGQGEECGAYLGVCEQLRVRKFNAERVALSNFFLYLCGRILGAG